MEVGGEKRGKIETDRKVELHRKGWTKTGIAVIGARRGKRKEKKFCVRNNFGNSKGDVVTPEMAKAAMEIAAKRPNPAAPVSGAELEADHLKDLPGTPLDPKTLVDPISLAPVTAAK